MQIRQDAATGTLERSAPGKFVETLVQIMQYLEKRQYDPKPKVDEYLRNAEASIGGLDDGLRICASRVGRAMYSLRNHRSIAHKGNVDANVYDLAFLLHAAQWILTELIRIAAAVGIAEAGRLVVEAQAPVGVLVESFGDRKLVLKDLAAKAEILVLLHSCYPSPETMESILKSADRHSARSVKDGLRRLWLDRLVDKSREGGYRLTQRGLDEALDVIKYCL
ncbi:MAG TPA: hypothetical protein VM221_12855 [Armatimonadota bacterium]|nr:hypothetical protein [Armatimonadota bacterium]